MTQKKIAIFLILMNAFLDWMGIGLVYPMFSSMLFHGHCQLLPLSSSDTTRAFCLGLLLCIAPLTQFFSAPILGSWSDLVGRKKVFLISLSIGVVGYGLGVLSIQYEHLLMLIISRVVVGISLGSAAVGTAALADISTDEEKPKNFGLVNMAAGAGFTIGPFLGGKLPDLPLFSLGYTLPFLFAGIGTLFNLIFILFLFKDTYLPNKKTKISALTGLNNIRKAFYFPKLRAVFLSVFIFSFGWSFYWEFIPITWIGEYGLSSSEIGNFYAYGSFFYAISCGLLIRPIVRIFRAQQVLFYALILTGISILGVLFYQSLNAWWFYIPIQQYLLAFLLPTAATIVSNSVDKTHQGETMGVFQAVEALAYGLSPLTSGIFAGINQLMPIIIGGISFLFAALVLSTSLRKEIFSASSKKESL